MPWSVGERRCGVGVISAEPAPTWHNRGAVSERFAPVEGLTRRVEQLAAGDPQSTRVIYAIVVALIVVGVALLLLAVWVIRRTRADLELLGPLERMGDSKWRKSGPEARLALLNEVRPAGAPVPLWPEPHDAAVVPAVVTELPAPVASPQPSPDPDSLVGPPVAEPVDAPELEPVDPPDPVTTETVDEPEAEPVGVPDQDVVDPANAETVAEQ